MLKKIFSINNTDIHKVITIMGIKFKFKNKYKILEAKLEYLSHILNESIKERKSTNYLYNNEFEAHTRKERGLCDITNATNFAERYKKLIKNMPEESITTIATIIKRLQVIKNNHTDIDIFTDKEKELLKDVKRKQNLILQLSENCFVYDNYFLPINHFEASVFYYKLGLNQIKNLKRINDKAIIDVGAFIGDSALILAPYTSNNVYCFEALKQNYNLIFETIKLNNLNNIIPENLALGSEETELEFRYNSAGSSKDPLMVKNPLYTEKCKVIKLDDYISKHNIKVGLIKVDIEGAEQDFIQGAIETIKTQKPILLLSIYHNVNDFLDIKSFIEELNLGYKFKIFKPTIDNISGETLLIAEVE